MISNIRPRSRGYMRRVSGCFCLEKQSNRDSQKKLSSQFEGPYEVLDVLEDTSNVVIRLAKSPPV